MGTMRKMKKPELLEWTLKLISELNNETSYIKYGCEQEDIYYSSTFPSIIDYIKMLEFRHDEEKEAISRAYERYKRLMETLKENRKLEEELSVVNQTRKEQVELAEKQLHQVSINEKLKEENKILKERKISLSETLKEHRDYCSGNIKWRDEEIAKLKEENEKLKET